MTLLRIFLSACFYYSGLVALTRWWTQHQRPCLIILNYHQASGGDLRRHLLYLHRHYRICHLEAALEELAIQEKQSAQGVHKKDQRTMLALTFDDGYSDLYTHAFPLVCELQIPITIFLIPAYMECGNAFWWSTHFVRLAQAEQVTLAERTYHLAQEEERKTLAQSIDAHFSQTTSPGEREALLKSLYALLSVPAHEALKGEPAPLLTWPQVREMQASKLVSFGGHTLHHPDLAQMADPIMVEREVGECRTILQQQLGRPARLFAYPFGSTRADGVAAVKQAGYDWALTIIPGVNTGQSDPYLLRRRSMNVKKHWPVVAAETAGIWGLFSRLKSSATFIIRQYLLSGDQKRLERATIQAEGNLR